MFLTRGLVLLLSGVCLVLASFPEARSECDVIHYNYCRLDEGNQFTTERLRGVSALTRELCQSECTLEDECKYFIWEDERCTFMRDPDQYFGTCRAVASSPHTEFQRCAATNMASGCAKADVGTKKKNNCLFRGSNLERLPNIDSAHQCEEACRLRNSKLLMRGSAVAEHERCTLFIYDTEDNSCELLGDTDVQCYRELGPSQEKGACLFDGIIFPTESSNEVTTSAAEGQVNRSIPHLLPALLVSVILAFAF